jgi:hypothetical protein
MKRVKSPAADSLDVIAFSRRRDHGHRGVVIGAKRRLPIARLMGPAGSVFATLMGPADRQGHGATELASD